MKKSWILFIPIILVIISGCAVGPPVQWQSGKEAYDKGEYSKAISYFKKATELAPQDGDNFRWLCVAYYRNGQYQVAIDACKKSLNLSHTKNVEHESWDFLSAAYDELGQKDSAISSRKKFIELKPDDSNSFAMLSRLYDENKQYDEAITAAKRAIELKSDNAHAYNNLGYAYRMKKQYNEAFNAFKKANEIDPANALYREQMGALFIDKEDYAEAIEAYKKSIEAAPFIPKLHDALAIAYYRMGRYDDAIASVNKAIELQTITGIGTDIAIESRYPYSGCPVVKGVMDVSPAKNAGILAGDWIIKIDGKSTKGWNPEQVVQTLRGTPGTQVVLTIARTGEWSNIDKIITRETIAKGVASSFGFRNLAYRYKGSLEAALKDAEKAYSFDSANAWARFSLGASYLDRGKYDDAIKLLAQVKDSPTARILEATAYVKLGKMKEAVNVYLSIPEEEMSPKNIPLMNNRMVLLQTFKPFVKEHRDKARSFESKGQYKEALSEFSEALKTADETEAQAIQESIFSMMRRNPSLSEMPEDARKYVLRGEVLIKEGNFEQAAKEFKKAIQIAPYAAKLYYNSALINAELKKYPEAIRNMKIYLKAAPDAPDARAAKDEIYKWEFIMEKGK